MQMMFSIGRVFCGALALAAGLGVPAAARHRMPS